MRIKVERSGGIAGIPISNEMETKDLPTDVLRTAKKLIENKKTSSLSMKSSPRGSADHYTYRISIHDGNDSHIVECSEYNIQNDLKSLIKYIEKHSTKMKAK